MAVAACWTPGTAAIARTAAGLTPVAVPAGPGTATTTSAPVACHDEAVSPASTASRTMPVNAATVTARTSVKAGRASVALACAARARPSSPMTPRRRADPRARPPSSSGYSRRTTTTAGTATSTGAALV